MLMLRGLLCLIICALIVATAAAVEKTTIALYQFTTEGASEHLASTLSDVITKTISQNDTYQLLSKEKMKLALDKLAENPDCKTDDCLTKIAKGLGVELLLTGHISMEGTNYAINLRLINSSTSKSIREICLCTQADLIERTKKVVQKLLDER